MAQQIYLGPNYRGLVRFMSFSNSIPAGLQAVVSESPEVQLLLVPMSSFAIVLAAIAEQGTPENQAYTKLAGAAPDVAPSPPTDGGGAGTIYDHPNPSKQLRTNGTVVNPADGVNEDGSINVRVISGGGGGDGGSAPVDVTLQNAATAAGNGTAFAPSGGNATLTFAITGTSTSRTVAFELADQSGTYQAITAFNVNDPTKYGTQTTAGSTVAPESWQVDVPVGWSFRARIVAAAGGNVTIKGKAVG